MTETKQKTEPQPSTRFRRIVTGSSQNYHFLGLFCLELNGCAKEISIFLNRGL